MTVYADSKPSFRVVAVDGGAASGKSSTSRLVASRLNLLHVDTGTHYRAVTAACLEAGLLPDDSVELRRFVASLELGSRVQGRESLICLMNSEPFAESQLRSEAVNSLVSRFAALPFLREAVKAYQRSHSAIALRSGFAGLIMDGRDIGTVILPEADLKIFLTADPATRQHRRSLEGSSDTIGDRDRIDSSRATAPLRPAPDAFVIDNSNLSLLQVVDRIIALFQRLPPVS